VGFFEIGFDWVRLCWIVRSYKIGFLGVCGANWVRLGKNWTDARLATEVASPVDASDAKPPNLSKSARGFRPHVDRFRDRATITLPPALENVGVKIGKNLGLSGG
jgi:hypothetical protein